MKTKLFTLRFRFLNFNACKKESKILKRKGFKMIKILFLASNPENTKLLKLDEEIRLIKMNIRAADFRDKISIEQFGAVRPDDLIQILLECRPNIVHFSGHGNSAGEIILMDKNRQLKPVSGEALQMLFATLKDNIRVVVLNACYSHVQAAAIAEVVECVVGMKKAVGDNAAIIFASSFYRAVGFGRSVKEAFDLGRTAILLEGIAEENTPQLLSRPDIKPEEVFLIEKGALASPTQTVEENHKIDVALKRDFIKALSACKSLQDIENRNAIIAQLPSDITNTISRHSSPLVDISNLVERCLDFQNGVPLLVETLYFYEGDTFQMKRVFDVLPQLGFDLI